MFKEETWACGLLGNKFHIFLNRSVQITKLRSLVFAFFAQIYALTTFYLSSFHSSSNQINTKKTLVPIFPVGRRSCRLQNSTWREILMSVVNDAESLCQMKELIKLIRKSWFLKHGTEVKYSCIAWDESLMKPRLFHFSRLEFAEFALIYIINGEQNSVIRFLSNHIVLSSTKSRL